MSAHKVVLKLPSLMFLLCFSLYGMAKSPAGMMDYKIDVGGGVIAPVSLPVSLVEEYRSNFIQAIKGIQFCQKGEYLARNPMLGKELIYEVANGEYGCRLDLRQYSSWHYVCQLSRSQVVALSSAMLERSETDAVLGDFSDKEKNVLYSACTMERQ